MTREERYDTFIDWVTFIEDRVNEWVRSLPNDVSKRLDWSGESLVMLEDYLLSVYTSDDQNNKEKRPALDAMVSYIGGVFQKNIPETIWKIDLDDKTNIFYDLPYLVFKLGVPVSPHHLVKAVLVERTGVVLERIFKQRLTEWNAYKDYMNRNA